MSSFNGAGWGFGELFVEACILEAIRLETSLLDACGRPPLIEARPPEAFLREAIRLEASILDACLRDAILLETRLREATDL